MSNPSRTPYDAEWRRLPGVVLHLVLWAVPFCIAFLAFLIWQGAVIGWETAKQFSERT